MLGFLRLVTHPKAIRDPKTSNEAWAIYREFRALPAIKFVAEPESLEMHFQSFTIIGVLPHRLWTDAYLAAFAIAGDYRLVSFDADFARFPGLNFLHLKP